MLFELLPRHGSAARILKDMTFTQRSDASLDPAVGRVLLFITAVVNVSTGSDHMSHLHHLWPFVLRKNRMLRSADILLYVGVEEYHSNDNVLHMVESYVHTFPNKILRICFVENMGYQAGAKDAMLDGVRNHWFEGYDWCSDQFKVIHHRLCLGSFG